MARSSALSQLLRAKLKKRYSLDFPSMRLLMLSVQNLSARRRAEEKALCATACVALRGVLRNAAAPSDAESRFVVLTRPQSYDLKIKPAMVSDQRSQPVAKPQPAGAVVEPIAAAQNLAALEAKAGAAVRPRRPSRSSPGAARHCGRRRSSSSSTSAARPKRARAWARPG